MPTAQPHKAAAFGLTRAERAGIPTQVLDLKEVLADGGTREGFDVELAGLVAAYEPDLIVLAGWMLILGEGFLYRFPDKVINLHPAKPGMFPGLGAIERSFEAWQAGRIDAGGVMVHFVPDEGVDDGPVIVTEEVPFQADDTLDRYTERVHQTEHRLLVEAIGRVLAIADRGALR